MSLVKCIDTGEKIEKTKAFVSKVEVHHRDGSISFKSVFYSSEDAYLQDRKEKELCRKCSDYIFFDILGYESGHDMNTNFYRRLQKWHKVYSYDVILETMKQMHTKQKHYVEKKDFQSEYQKIQYWSSVIENNLEDTYQQSLRNERIAQKQNAVVEAFDDVEFIPTKHKSVNVKSLLGDIE